jgi:tetratricopeptide (TPR) repeat protein
MNEYLALLEAGRTDVEAFEEAFGISMKNLRMEMREYLNGNYEALAVPLAAFDHEDFIPRVKELSQEEISIALGDLAVAHENSRLAGELFHAALAAHPTSARAHTGLGNTFALRGAWKQAISKYQRALEIDPESAETELDYANCIQERALKQEDPAKRRELLKEARQHYVRSYKLNPGIPETYAMYGKTFLAPREYPARGIEALDRARGLLPANPTILRLLAKAYVLTERESDARALVERIVANEHGGDRVLKVDEVLEEIRNENVDAAGEGRERANAPVRSAMAPPIGKRNFVFGSVR